MHFDQITFTCRGCGEPGLIRSVAVNLTRVALEGHCQRCDRDSWAMFDLLRLDQALNLGASEPAADLDAAGEPSAGLARWRQRRLDARFPYLIVAAPTKSIRRGGSVMPVKTSVVVGLSNQGVFEGLGAWVMGPGDGSEWNEVWRDLTSRGLKGVRYVVSEDRVYLRRSLQQLLPSARWQLCHDQFVREIVEAATPAERSRLEVLLRHSRQVPTLPAAREVLQEARRGACTQTGLLLSRRLDHVLGMYEFPPEHRSILASTEPLERYLADMIPLVYPHERACIDALTLLAMDVGWRWKDPRRTSRSEVPV